MQDYDPGLPNVNANFNAAVSARAYIFNDNIQCFKGIIRLMQINIDQGIPEYEVCVFGELGGLVSALGNKKLEDLNFSAYDHTFNETNIAASWDNENGGSGYYYPLIDYGTYSTDKHNWRIGTFRPALFIKEYIDKIFAGANYTYNCALFSTDRFKRLIVPNNQKILQRLSSQLLTASRTTGITVLTSSGIATNTAQWQTVTTSIFTPSISNSRFTYTGGSAITIVLTWDIRGTRRNHITPLRHVIRKNGVDISSTSVTYAPNPATYLIPYYWHSNVTVSLNPGDYLDFYYEATASGSDPTYLMTFDYDSFSINSSVPVLVPVLYGDPVTINDQIPRNILQKDFFSWICKLFNLYVYEDPTNENYVNIAPFVDFYSSAVAQDWSNKIDRSKVLKIKPMSELNSRYYLFTFKDDSDYYNDLYKKRYNLTYGSFLYDSQYEFANEKTTVEVGFAGTPLVGYGGEDKVYSTIFKRQDASVRWAPVGSTSFQTSSPESTQDSVIRILLAKKVTGVSSWDLQSSGIGASTTVYASYTKYGYAGHVDDPNNPANDIQFGTPQELFFTLAAGALNVNQFNVYWSTYMAEITDKDARLLTATIKLNYRDIYNLDFSNYIYIDGLNYRLNKILDFNATREDTCTIELLKVNNLIY